MREVPGAIGFYAEEKPGAMKQASLLAERFEELFPRIYGYALYRLRDPEEANDIVSTTFTEAVSNIDRFDPEKGSLDTWLLAIARNVIRKYLRARRIRKLVSFELLSNNPSTSLRWIEEIADNNELLREMIPLLRRLPDRERDILSLKFGAGITNRSIAEIVGLTESNVGVILYRTLRRLRDQLMEDDDVEI